MYLEPWQVFLGGCVIGTLISFITLAVLIFHIIGRIGIRSITADSSSNENKTDLIAKLCFILLAKGYLDEIDNEFMIDGITFNDWKQHIDEMITEEEGDEPDAKV